MNENEMQRIKQNYDLFVKRYTATPYTPRQADVYKRIRSFLDECDTADIATERMRKEGYNMETTCAVPADKVYACMCAAREFELDELAEACRKVYDEMVNDSSTAFQTGFYADLQKERDKVQRKMEIISACFTDFLAYDIYQSFDDKEEQYIRNADALQNAGISLSDILKKKAYRQCLSCDDAYMQRFINEYPAIAAAANSKKTNEAEMKALQETLDAEWPKIKDRKDDLQKIYKSNTTDYKFSLTLSKAPDSSEGDYQYTNETSKDLGEDWI